MSRPECMEQMVKRDLTIKNGRNDLPLSAAAIKTNEGKTAKNILPAAWKEEPEKSAGISRSAEIAGYGSVNGAVSRFLMNKHIRRHNIL